MNQKLIMTGLLLVSLLVASCTNGQQTTATAPTPTTAAAAAVTPTTEATAEVVTPTVGITATVTTTTTAATTATTGVSTTSSAAQDTTPKIVAAANAFLATLSDTEKKTGVFDWSDTAQKQRWSNFPPAGFKRAGLMWGNLSEAQQNAWLALMQATLSTEGYNRVLAEWNADGTIRARRDWRRIRHEKLLHRHYRYAVGNRRLAVAIWRAPYHD